MSQMEWAGQPDDDLLVLAQREFDVFLTVDRHRSIQQAVGRYTIASIVMIAGSHRVHDLRSLVDEVLAVCRYTTPGQVVRVGAP